MKEQIEKLIATGRTEEALAMLAKITDEALLLQARLANAKKQFNNGLVDYGTWSIQQNQINFGALALCEQLEKDEATNTEHATKNDATDHSASVAKPQKTKKVFISYNHTNVETARRVKQTLQAHGITVIIDEDNLDAADNIMDFIQVSIKSCDAVLSIVSPHSIASTWVGYESMAALYAVWIADKLYIPVRLEDFSFDIQFQIKAQTNIQAKLDELETGITELRKIGGDTRAYDDDRNRLYELKSNLGKIMQRLKSVSTLDISEKNYEASMKKVVERILEA